MNLATFKKIKEINGHKLKMTLVVSRHSNALRYDLVGNFKGVKLERVCYSADKLMETVEALETAILREPSDIRAHVAEILDKNGFVLQEVRKVQSENHK